MSTFVSTGTLHNIEYKEALDHSPRDRDHKVFQGGNWRDLHRMLGVQYGDKILYVADHMFNDILRYYVILQYACAQNCH